MTEIFHIVPATSRTAMVWIPLFSLLFVVLVGSAALATLSATGSRTATFELGPEGLRLRGDLYGRRIAPSLLRGGSARVVDLDSEQSLRPSARTMGTAIPGYRGGWFRLSNGEKALLYVTDPRRVVYVPTRAGYSLLLSVDRPAEFVNRLRAIAPST